MTRGEREARFLLDELGMEEALDEACMRMLNAENAAQRELWKEIFDYLQLVQRLDDFI